MYKSTLTLAAVSLALLLTPSVSAQSLQYLGPHSTDAADLVDGANGVLNNNSLCSIAFNGAQFCGSIDILNSGQPDSDGETRQGAINRVAAARDARSNADFWVGLEGGIESQDDRLMAFAWMAVQDRHGTCGEARTVTLPLPPAVKELIDGGLELGEANDRVFSTINSKQGGGAFGLLTNGLHTREGVYAQAMTIALIPFVHELFTGSD